MVFFSGFGAPIPWLSFAQRNAPTFGVFLVFISGFVPFFDGGALIFMSFIYSFIYF